MRTCAVLLLSMLSLWGTGCEAGGGADPASDGAKGARPPGEPPLLRRRGVPLSDVYYVALGLFQTVLCAEFLPNTGGVAALDERAAAQRWLVSDAADQARACAAWPVHPVDPALREPVVSTVPALLLSGEIDLNTLAAWGDHALETLPNATHVVIPYATHSTLGVPCAASLMGAFIRSGGDVEGLDTSCTEAIPPPAW